MSIAAEERVAVEQLLYEEARLLDERRFDEWLALFADDGLYWVPADPAQASPQDGLSLFYERKPLLSIRVARLQEPRLHADRPPAARTIR